MWRKLLFLTVLLCFTGTLFSQRDANDTLIIKRQRYSGIFVGGLFFIPDPGYVTDHAASPVIGLGQQLVRLSMDNSWQGGFFFTFPFLHKMDWNFAFMVEGFIRTRVFTNVTGVSATSPPVATSYSTTTDHDFFVVPAIQSHFCYEILTRENRQLTIGLGGWLGSGKLTDSYDPGAGGAEVAFNYYQRIHDSACLRLTLCPGAMKLGPYLSATVGYCFMGYRTMHAHPKHYYVRTYDYNE